MWMLWLGYTQLKSVKIFKSSGKCIGVKCLGVNKGTEILQAGFQILAQQIFYSFEMGSLHF
jgi:hypothetical protein